MDANEALAERFEEHRIRLLRSDRGTLPGSAVVRGPQAVAAQALGFTDPSRIVHPVLVNGAAGVSTTGQRWRAS